jgi:hypothetical protein
MKNRWDEPESRHVAYGDELDRTVPKRQRRELDPRRYAQFFTDLTNASGGAGIRPQSLAATFQGASIDMQNGEVATNMIVELGAFSPGSSISLQIQAEEWNGQAGSTWTAIPNMILSVTGSNQRQVLLGLRTYRYLRANAVTVGGTTAAYNVAVEFLAQPKSESQSGGYSRSPNIN